MVYTEIGKKIRELRKENGLTLKLLSTMTGAHVGYLSNIETGARTPSLDMLKSIAEALNTTVGELVSGKAELSEAVEDFYYADDNQMDEIIAKEKATLMESSLQIANVSEVKEHIIPPEFAIADEARAYIKMHAIFGSGGFDVNKMSDEEVINFANEMLRQAELISYKYKK